MATIDVGPVDLTPAPASQWGLHWDADGWGDAILIPLAPELLVGDVLTPIAHGALALARSDATLTLTLDASVWTFGGADYRPVVATDLPAFLDAVQAVEGSQLAFRVGVGMCIIGGILVVALLEHVIAEPRNPLAEELAAADEAPA